MFKPLALAAAVLTAFSFNAFAAKTELTVYTALEAEQLKTYKQAFEKANPDVEIKWVRDSTGIITAKLLAEKARPQADAVWGLAASSLAILDQQGMLQSYAPKDLAKIGANYRDAANPPTSPERSMRRVPRSSRVAGRRCFARPGGLSRYRHACKPLGRKL